MKDLYVVNCCRTAIGSFGGSLKNVPAAEMGAIVVKEALKRANVAPENVDELMFGNCTLVDDKGNSYKAELGIYWEGALNELQIELADGAITAEEAKNKAEQVVYQAEKMMKDNGDKIPADTKSQLQAAIDEIKSKKDNGTKEEIDAAVNKFVLACSTTCNIRSIQCWSTINCVILHNHASVISSLNH